VLCQVGGGFKIRSLKVKKWQKNSFLYVKNVEEVKKNTIFLRSRYGKTNRDTAFRGKDRYV
jgi:hypothetical protein